MDLPDLCAATQPCLFHSDIAGGEKGTSRSYQSFPPQTKNLLRQELWFAQKYRNGFKKFHEGAESSFKAENLLAQLPTKNLDQFLWSSTSDRSRSESVIRGINPTASSRCEDH